MPGQSFITKYRYPIIFLLVSIILYGNTIFNGYALDDEFVTGPKNITAKGIKSIPGVFKSFHVNDESGNYYEYRPMVKVTYALEHQIFGDNVAISHFINLLFYSLCLLVLFKLLCKAFAQYNAFIHFVTVIIFAFVPLHSEVVASLKNRDVMLSFIFTMLGFIQIIQYSETKKWYYLLLAALSMLCAYLSKFDVVPFLLIIPVVLFQQKKINFKQAAFVLVVFLFAYVSYRLTKRILLDRTIHASRVFLYFENPMYFEKGLMQKLSATLNSLGFYFKMLVWPSKMACYYGYNVINVFSVFTLFSLLGLSGGAGMLYVLWNRLKKPDLLWYGIFIFGASISMYLNFATPAPGIVADRFAFFASVGSSLACSYLLFEFKMKKKQFLTLKDIEPKRKNIAILVLVAFAAVIFVRNRAWKSKLTLFETDVKKYPESVKLSLLTSAQVIIHMNDGSNTIKENEKVNKIRNAERLLIEAIKTDSSCAGCYNNIAFLFLTFERDPVSALPYLRLGFKRDSTKKELACNIGIALFRMGKPQEALPYLYKSIELDKKKDFSVPYEVLQDLYSKTNPNEGIKFFDSKLKEGTLTELMNVLIGKTYFEAKDTANSILYYKEALRLNPDNKPVADFVNNLEIKYLKKNW